MQNDKPLRGKVAVLTGASRGLGAAIAEALAARGANLILTGRDLQALGDTVRRCSAHGAEVAAHSCEVRDREQVSALFAAVQRAFKQIHILVNNAGVAHEMKPVQELDPEIWEQTVDTNLTGTFLVTKYALPMIGEGGVIANMVSVAAKTTFVNLSAYCASKAGQLMFSNVLREEVRGRGIRVISVLPGPTDTEIWNQFWADAPREKMMLAATVAESVVNAMLLPANTSVDELTIAPVMGVL